MLRHGGLQITDASGDDRFATCCLVITSSSEESGYFNIYVEVGSGT